MQDITDTVHRKIPRKGILWKDMKTLNGNKGAQAMSNGMEL